MLSALLGDYIKAIAIIAIVILNAVLGLVQEGRAEAALEEALQNLAAPVALAIRGGHRVPVPARELVPGDLVVLEAGNNVPADLRRVETVAITAAALGAYLIGLRGHNEVPLMADTMAFVTLSSSELLRAFSARSERLTVFQIGLGTNRMMVIAVAASLMLLLLLVVYVPFLQPIFDTVPLGWAQWRIVGPLLLVPAVSAEITKIITQRLTRQRTPAWGRADRSDVQS